MRTNVRKFLPRSMTIYLSSILSSSLTGLAQSDSHGWILTLISICVVFGCLLILFGLYSLSGALFGKKLPSRRHKGRKHADRDTEAAIALTLHLFLNETDAERQKGTITIRKSVSPWGDKALTFRRRPGR